MLSVILKLIETQINYDHRKNKNIAERLCIIAERLYTEPEIFYSEQRFFIFYKYLFSLKLFL